MNLYYINVILRSFNKFLFFSELTFKCLVMLDYIRLFNCVIKIMSVKFDDSAFALIPYRLENPKSRLSGLLRCDERKALSRLMLEHTIRTLSETGFKNVDILLKTPGTEAVPEKSGRVASDCNMFSDSFLLFLNELFEDGFRLRFFYDPHSLNDAINGYIDSMENTSILIMMADLPLTDSSVLKRMICMEEDIVIAPGRGGGTNILWLSNAPDFRVKYHGTSFIHHVRQAEKSGYSVGVFDSFFAGTDIDEPDDLSEILVHGSGPVCAFVTERFEFKSEKTKGRLQIRRTPRSNETLYSKI